MAPSETALFLRAHQRNLFPLARELDVRLFLGTDEIQGKVYSVHKTRNLFKEPITRSEAPNEYDMLNREDSVTISGALRTFDVQ